MNCGTDYWHYFVWVSNKCRMAWGIKNIKNKQWEVTAT